MYGQTSNLPTSFQGQKVLADELDDLKDEQIRKTKYRQQLMDAPEIKELQLQLRTAYTRKELQAQLDAKKLEKLKNNVYVDIEKKEFEKSLKRTEEEEAAFKQVQKLAQMEYRRVLHDQMMHKYHEKIEEHNAMLKERMMIDKAVKNVLEEDKMELQIQKMKLEASKKDIEEFKQAKAVWLLKEKQKEVDEELRINEYLKKKSQEEDEMKERERLKQEKLINQQQRIADIISQIEDGRAEHARVIQIIVEEEERQKAERRELEEAMKEYRSKQQLRIAFTKQIEERIMKLHLERVEEEEYIKKKMEEYEEDKKYQQMTAQKQKLMKLEYRLSLQKEFEEKQNRRKAEEEQLLEFRKTQEEAENERSRMLEEERIRLLQDHAVNVLGFLPPGLLKPSDLPHLPPDVREFYCSNPEPIFPPAR